MSTNELERVGATAPQRKNLGSMGFLPEMLRPSMDIIIMRTKIIGSCPISVTEVADRKDGNFLSQKSSGPCLSQFSSIVFSAECL